MELPELPDASIHEVYNAHTKERQVSTHGIAYYGSNWRLGQELHTTDAMRAYGIACAQAALDAAAKAVQATAEGAGVAPLIAAIRAIQVQP